MKTVFLLLVQVPIRDVRVDALTPDFTIGAERSHFVIKFLIRPLDRAEILVGITPWIFWQLGEVSADLPFFGNDSDRRFFNQRFEALFRGGVDAVIQFVELERPLKIANLYFSRCAFGIIGPAHDAGDDQRRKDGQNGHDNHDFNEGKTTIIVKTTG